MAIGEVDDHQLAEIANKLRIEVIKMVYRAQSGHIGGPLSSADILAVLYWRFMRISPHDPSWSERDRFVLSKGHSCPALYAALALRGYFDASHLATLRRYGSILQGHPSMKHTPGVDMSTGSLGQGLSAACGMALGAKCRDKGFRVYALLSDGELDEGLTWEAAMFAHHYRLDNLTAIIDFNGLQLDGRNEEIMGIEPLPDKWRSFGWHTVECDGHDFGQLTDALNQAVHTSGSPSAVIAHTVKGKGVSFMEDQCDWHGSIPTDEQFELAMKELSATEERRLR